MKIWCDTIIHDQVNDETNPFYNGALYCHACKTVHGCANDAVNSFMYMADATGHKKYLDVTLKLLNWSVFLSI